MFVVKQHTYRSTHTAQSLRAFDRFLRAILPTRHQAAHFNVAVQALELVYIQVRRHDAGVIDHVLTRAQALVWVGGIWMPLFPILAAAVMLVWFYAQMGLMFLLCHPRESSFRLRKAGLAFKAVRVAVVTCARHHTLEPGAVGDHVHSAGANHVAADLLADRAVWSLPEVGQSLLRGVDVHQRAAGRPARSFPLHWHGKR